MQKWLRLASEPRAVTSMEYALIGSLIALVIIGAVGTVGNTLQTVFNTFASSL